MIHYSKLKTVPLASRRHKANVNDFAQPPQDILDMFPNILAGKSLKTIIGRLRSAREHGIGIIWALGAHTIKCGLAPVFGQLMQKGYVSHIALNGAGIIHDFEIAYCGATSECVESSIKDGSFGMATETSEILGSLVGSSIGIGENVKEYVATLPYSHMSISGLASKYAIPVTVHPALGTDVLHYHPSVDWAKLGAASKIDFDRFVEAIPTLNHGGVYLNVGSAVILPEIFLKSLSIQRNLGFTIENFTTVVFDMIDHYRPRENVVRRPGGDGHVLIGHHEIMIPLLNYLL